MLDRAQRGCRRQKRVGCFVPHFDPRILPRRANERTHETSEGLSFFLFCFQVALKELSIRGDIRTTVEYIGEVLQSADFISNRIDTGW